MNKTVVNEYNEKIKNMPREKLNAFALNLLALIAPLLKLSEIAEVIVKASDNSEQDDSRNESAGS